MATEPRRSSRANKGKHSLLDALTAGEDSPPQSPGTTPKPATKPAAKTPAKPAASKPTKTPKKAAPKKAAPKSKAKSKAAASAAATDDDDDDEADEGVVRCVCGLSENDPDDDKELMAQCEKCLCWQHPECTLGITDEKDVPDLYFCEQCRPDLHPAEAPGAAKAAARASGRTGGRAAGRAGAAAAVSDASESADDQADGQADENTDKSAGKAGGAAEGRSTRARASPRPEPAKRRRVESPEADSAYKPEQTRRKSSASSAVGASASSAARAGSPAAKVASIDELTNNVRKSVANAFFAILDKAAAEAVADGSLESETPKELALSLAIDLEHAMYTQLASKTDKDVGAKYRDKFRTISFNLKDAKNGSFRARVLSGELAAETTIGLSSEEMMNPELQKLAETVRAESISQSILKKTEMPRIRRTHKGEEFVGDVDENITLAETAPEAASTVADDARGPSPRTHPATDAPPRGSLVGDDLPPLRLPSPSPPPGERDFDVHQMWTAVDKAEGSRSPSRDTPVLSPGTHSASATPVPANRHRQDDDAEIDQLINSDDEAAGWNTSVETVVWRGRVSMFGVAEFEAKAVQVGGPLMGDRSWSDVMAPAMVIDGRLAQDRAERYLDTVAATKDLVAVRLTPAVPASPGFVQLFEYFKSRQRFGVVKNRLPSVKDAYLVPLAPDDAVPAYCSASTAIERETLVAVYVVHRGYTPPAFAAAAPADDQYVPPGLADDGYDPTAGYTPAPVYAPTTTAAQDQIISALGLRDQDVQLLRQILAAHPEVANNPQLASDPMILISLVQRYQSQS
ncbi:transcription factor S-II, central domain-containing protein [Dipodascopsis tothii]|uniref:transcription factor S-II, central domain-containing protein n=1 Tax=Dipodascopsis tothii TaxID=44089 RepID=UPI0034CFB085